MRTKRHSDSAGQRLARRLVNYISANNLVYSYIGWNRIAEEYMKDWSIFFVVICSTFTTQLTFFTIWL